MENRDSPPPPPRQYNKIITLSLLCSMDFYKAIASLKAYKIWKAMKKHSYT